MPTDGENVKDCSSAMRFIIWNYNLDPLIMRKLNSFENKNAEISH